MRAGASRTAPDTGIVLLPGLHRWVHRNPRATLRQPRYGHSATRGSPYGLPAQADTLRGQFWTPIEGQHSTPIDSLVWRSSSTSGVAARRRLEADYLRGRSGTSFRVAERSVATVRKYADHSMSNLLPAG